MKNRIKSILGNILAALQPKRVAELTKGGTATSMTISRNLNDRLICYSLLKKTENSKNFDALSGLHHNFWREQGDDYFSNLDDNVLEGFFKPNCSPLFKDLKKMLKTLPENFNTMVEIGTGQGDVLNYLSYKFPLIDSFVGIDLSPSQTSLNQKKYQENTRLEYVASDGLDWIQNHGTGNMIFFTSRGVLEYLTEERLKQLFKELSGLGRTIFIAIEPIGKDVDFEIDKSSQPYGVERSFSHNYAMHFKNAGFKIWHERKIPFNLKEFDFCAIGAIC